MELEKYKDKLNLKLQEKHHKEKSDEVKLKEVREYAKHYNLKFEKDTGFLFAYRNHNINGSGMYRSNEYYEKGETYRDWHVDMDETEANSFGLGIFPKGNTQVKVHYTDWGCHVNRDDGKCRV